MALEGYNQKTQSISNVPGSNLVTVAAGRSPQGQTQPNLMRQGQSSSPSASAVMGGARAKLQEQESLLQNLENFSKFAIGIEKAGVVEKAKNDAYKAVANDEPFHKQSIYSLYGRTYNNVMTADYAAKANLQISSRSLELSTKFANDPEGYDRSMSEFIRSYSENAPTPELSSVIAINGAKVRTSGYGKLKTSENEAIRRDKVETFSQNIGLIQNQIIEMAAQGKEADVRLAIDANEQYVDAMEREGLIDSATAQSVKKNARFNITHGSAIRELDGILEKQGLISGAAYVKANTSINRDDMDVKEQHKYRTDLERMLNAAIKKEKANQVSKKKLSKAIVKDAKEVLNNNKMPSNMEEIDEALQYLSPIEQEDYRKKVEAHNIIDMWGDLSLSQKRVAYEEYKRSGVADIIDVEVENKIESILKEQEARANNDVVGLAIEQSVIHPLVSPMGIDGGVEGLSAGLSEMRTNTELIQAEYGSQYTNLLSKADAKGWNDWFNNPQIPVVNKLAMINEVATSHPDLMDNVFRQIGGKNAGMFTFAATLSTSGNAKAAEISLLGSMSGATLEPDFKGTLSSYIGNAFAGYPGVNKGMEEGIANYAKGVITQTDSGSELRADEATEATIGEVVNWNGQNTILPVGVSKRDFANRLDNITLPGRPNLEKGLRDMSDWTFNGDYQLRYAGAGKYYVRVTGDNPKMVKDKDGSLFTLTWGEF